MAKRTPLGVHDGPFGLPCTDVWELNMQAKIQFRLEASPSHLFAALGGGRGRLRYLFYDVISMSPKFAQVTLESQK